VVELKSGRRIRAQSIQRDQTAPDRVILSVGHDQIQMSRSVAWNAITRITASSATLMALQVPEGVATSDRDANSIHEVKLNPSPENAERNTAELRSFFRFPPPPPAPEIPESPGTVFEPASIPLLPVPPCGTQFGQRIRPPEGTPCGMMPVVFFRDPGVVVGVRYADPSCAHLAAPMTGPMTNPAGIPTTAVEVPTPQELFVTARAFNRQGLADWNSLEVYVQGKTASGLPCRVRGSLKCTLWARRTQLVRAYGEHFFEDPLELFVLGSWTQFLEGTEVDATGMQKVVLALPSRSPDHTLRVSQYGLMTVDLDIPGQGRLATSTEPIALRRVGPIRDRSIVDFGSSLLPRESVSEGVNASGDWPAPLSDLRPDSRRFTVQP